MKKRILCLILSLVMLVGMTAVFTACGGDGGTCEHVDVDNDKKCDKCQETVKVHKHFDEDNDKKCDGCGRNLEDDTEETIEYPWADEAPVSLIFQMTNNSASKELASGCNRYLAGGDQALDQDIDDMILERNTAALDAVNVTVSYEYWPDHANYGHSHCAEIMYTNSISGATGKVPDMYCNFTYDMGAASVKGAFANLKSTSRNRDGANYFAFNDPTYDELIDNQGYMYDYMTCTTLNPDKMYVLASDYFTDLIRAFFIVPVNKTLLESVGMDITGDRDDDGDFDMTDFYMAVWNKEWNYDLVGDYSTAIFSGNAADGESMHDILGFAIGTGGMQSTGILYSTNITVIERIPNDDGTYEYEYPEESPQLIELFNNISDLMDKVGVMAVRHADGRDYGQTNTQAIRARFCDSKILFGDVMMVGALEYEEYQTLKDGDGFGVLPVPLYHEVALDDPENYLTTIHNVGRSGAIAANTKKFAECTAFLNYQSTHSTDILNEYYEFNLQYGIADGSSETVEMLQYIRNNVRSVFDCFFEDIIGYRNKLNDEEVSGTWKGFLNAANQWKHDISKDYDTYRDLKQSMLDVIEADYIFTPD